MVLHHARTMVVARPLLGLLLGLLTHPAAATAARPVPASAPPAPPAAPASFGVQFETDVKARPAAMPLCYCPVHNRPFGTSLSERDPNVS